MIASLPMYWRDETASTWRRFWKLVQGFAGRDGLNLPELTAPNDVGGDLVSHWVQPDLVLSMTCGYPLRTVLKTRVDYVGTFDFGLPDAPPGHYRSCAICAAERVALDGTLTLAFSGRDSQSGWACVSDPGAENPNLAFDDLLETGSHAASMVAVAEGRADVAYVDAVTWALSKRFDPISARLRVAGLTSPTPGLPLITRAGGPVEPLRTALRDACMAFPEADAAMLGGLNGFVVLDTAKYFTVPDHLPRIA